MLIFHTIHSISVNYIAHRLHLVLILLILWCCYCCSEFINQSDPISSFLSLNIRDNTFTLVLVDSRLLLLLLFLYCCCHCCYCCVTLFIKINILNWTEERLILWKKTICGLYTIKACHNMPILIFVNCHPLYVMYLFVGCLLWLWSRSIIGPIPLGGRHLLYFTFTLTWYNLFILKYNRISWHNHFEIINTHTTVVLLFLSWHKT